MTKRHRGLEDLLAEHDQELGFLDAYGAAGEGESGLLPAGTGRDPPEEILKAAIRLLRAEGQSSLAVKERSASIPDCLEMVSKEDGLRLNISANADLSLPLVASDLAAPGMEAGSLAADARTAEVTIVQWGVPARTLLARLAEFWATSLPE